jgi:uncharacterized membrane protein
MKNKITNWISGLSITIAAFLGVSTALDLKLPSNVLMILGTVSALGNGATSYATGKTDDLKDK